MQPWILQKIFEHLRHEVEGLVDAMHKYSEYLKDKSSKVVEHHQSPEPSQSNNNATLIVCNAVQGPPLPEYVSIEETLRPLPMFTPVCLMEYAPDEKYARRKWLANLRFPFPVHMYRYAYGNALGTITYVWKTPDGPVDQTAVSHVFADLTMLQKKYSTRAMRQDFLSKYSRLVKIPKCILRNVYRTLLCDGSTASSGIEAEVDARVARAILEVTDPEIILDLHKSNGKVNVSHFDRFWEELQSEISLAVDERRHGDVLHMPFATSLRHLRELISDRLKEKYPDNCPLVPGLEWIRLQFWPSNQYTTRALKYTGKFKVKFGVQVRQLHKDHQDSHYVSALLQYVKSFAIAFSTHCNLVSVDDKAIIPVGEPYCPISTGVRGHNRSLVSIDGPQLLALDHDFHVHGIVPSVAFFINTPESIKDSFFSGEAMVTLKEKVTQPSSALRHARELSNIIRTHYGDFDRAKKPIMVIVSDGGQDHRVTFGSVKVSNICLFRALDLDMLIHVRTCPYQSWQNVAERVMSTLNLALQNVSLSRSSMPAEFEALVSNKNTLADVRKEIKKKPELGDALRDAMVSPMVAVGGRFQAMKINDTPIKLGVPATVQEIS